MNENLKIGETYRFLGFDSHELWLFVEPKPISYPFNPATTVMQMGHRMVVTLLEIHPAKPHWFRVQCKDQEGWLQGQLIAMDDFTSKPQAEPLTPGLRYRAHFELDPLHFWMYQSAKSHKKNRLAQFPNGDPVVTFLEHLGPFYCRPQWTKVRYQGFTGWIFASLDGPVYG